MGHAGDDYYISSLRYLMCRWICKSREERYVGLRCNIRNHQLQRVLIVVRLDRTLKKVRSKGELCGTPL